MPKANRVEIHECDALWEAVARRLAGAHPLVKNDHRLGAEVKEAFMDELEFRWFDAHPNRDQLDVNEVELRIQVTVSNRSEPSNSWWQAIQRALTGRGLLAHR
jgi:hypothetical protein